MYIYTHTHTTSSILPLYVCMSVYIHIYIQWNTTQPEKGEFSTCKNIDGPREYYA